MFKLFSTFSKKVFQNFQVKRCVSETENTLNSNTQLLKIALPNFFILPIANQNITKEEIKKICCVKEGDYVLRGQSLTFNRNCCNLPIHAPTSGKVVSINSCYSDFSEKNTNYFLTIRADGEDRWIERDTWKNYRQHSHQEIFDRIYQYGVDDFRKTNHFLANSDTNRKQDTLIINATECESYITADYQLIKDSAEQIIEGIQILDYILKPLKILISIEKDKKQSIFLLRKALENSYNHNIHLFEIPAPFSSRSKKKLAEIVIGKRIPYGKQLLDFCIIIKDISTVYAIKRAIIDGEPMTERIVTLTGGNAVPVPSNVLVRFGTTIHDLLKVSGIHIDKHYIVIINGLLSGFVVPWLNIPVMKTTNCLLVFTKKELDKIKKQRNCIHCNACTDVCPENLMPQQLYFFIKNNQYEKVLDYNLRKCTECGACAEICPSNIPLIQYFRQQKAENYVAFVKEKRVKKAKMRFEIRRNRLVKLKKEKLKKDLLQSFVQLNVRSSNQVDNNVSHTLKKNTSEILNISTISNDSHKLLSSTHARNLRKAAVQAAIARVKASKYTHK